MVNCRSLKCGFETVRDTREEAVSAWNRRPVEDDLRARVAELEEALMPFAAEGMTFHPRWKDEDRVATSIYDDDIHDLVDKANFTVGDLRRAMRVMGVSSVFEKLEAANV
jgi:hypothetical protein